MMTPQLTAQYGQVLRVSVEREIFRLEACAISGRASKPKTVIPTAPAMPVLKNARLDTSITQPSMTKDSKPSIGAGMERKRSESAMLKVRQKCVQCGPHLHQAVRLRRGTQTMQRSVYPETCAGQMDSRCLKSDAWELH